MMCSLYDAPSAHAVGTTVAGPVPDGPSSAVSSILPHHRMPGNIRCTATRHRRQALAHPCVLILRPALGSFGAMSRHPDPKGLGDPWGLHGPVPHSQALVNRLYPYHTSNTPCRPMVAHPIQFIRPASCAISSTMVPSSQ